MKTVNMILSGLGGQGILFMTKVLARTALRKGMNVLGAETHGMAQRGGSVISHLRLGDCKSSLINTGSCHYLLSLDEDEAYRNIHFLTRNARLYVNASSNFFPRREVTPYLEKMEIKCRSVSAASIAMELNAVMASNLALLGFMSAFKDGPFSSREIRETVESISPEKFKPLNLKVFNGGFEKGMQALHKG